MMSMRRWRRAEHALHDPAWRAMDPSERGRVLRRIAEVTYSQAKTLAALESKNNGKTFREALSEIRYGASTFEYFAGLTDKIEGSTIPVPGDRLDYTLRQPLGVTAHIIPWNFPLQLALRSIAPALATGPHRPSEARFMDTVVPPCMGPGDRGG